MQHAGRSPDALAAYHDYLQSDHDFRVWADVLTIDQKYVGTLDLLDGQQNYANGNDGPVRTGSVTLSDPEGALNFGVDWLRDPKGVLWINRLVQVWHEVTVPGYGDFTTSCMVGLPTSVARSGAEVSLEMGDKSLLADHGVRPRTYKKGQRVDLVLRSLLGDCTGERFMRIPKTKRTLSRTYAVGMGENSLTPWQAFKRIASQEMNWRAYYDGLGWAVAEPISEAKNPVTVHSLLALPSASASLTDFSNYVRVTSHRTPVNKQKTKNVDESRVTTIYDSIVALPSTNELSEQSLARNGVPRTLPLVVVNDDLKTLKDTLTQATNELKADSGLDTDKTYEIIPLFHLDPFDYVKLPEGVGNVRLAEGASTPYGTGGNMTIGTHRWVSRPPNVKQIRSKTTRHRKKKKGGKKD
jgi:hypothetical protein